MLQLSRVEALNLIQLLTQELANPDCQTVKVAGFAKIHVEAEPVATPEWTPPQWCQGLSKRTADGLVRRAQYDNLEQVIHDRLTKPDSHFTNISNFGSKCLAELDEWLKKNDLV